MRMHSVLFPYVRAAALHPKLSRIPSCYGVFPSELSKSVLGKFADTEAFAMRKFVGFSGV